MYDVYIYSSIVIMCIHIRRRYKKKISPNMYTTTYYIYTHTTSYILTHVNVHTYQCIYIHVYIYVYIHTLLA